MCTFYANPCFILNFVLIGRRLSKSLKKANNIVKRPVRKSNNAETAKNLKKQRIVYQCLNCPAGTSSRRLPIHSHIDSIHEAKGEIQFT